jgi:hypothetical protein
MEELDSWLMFVFFFFLELFRKINEMREKDNFTDDKLKVLLENLIATYGEYSDCKNYYQYLKLWCIYADISEDPHHVFTYMQQENIGLQYALFYECWALVFETANDYVGALKVYEQGLKRFSFL